MKYLKKFAVILCAAVLLLCMTSCAGAGSSISVPKGQVPTISENIDTLRKSGYRIRRQHYCSVKSVLETGTGYMAELSGESVSVGRVARITLTCPSHGMTVMSSPNILYPGGSAIKVGQSCCIVTCTDQMGAYSVNFLVFGG